jgi:hypothetical protein
MHLTAANVLLMLLTTAGLLQNGYLVRSFLERDAEALNAAVTDDRVHALLTRAALTLGSNDDLLSAAVPVIESSLRTMADGLLEDATQASCRQAVKTVINKMPTAAERCSSNEPSAKLMALVMDESYKLSEIEAQQDHELRTLNLSTVAPGGAELLKHKELMARDACFTCLSTGPTDHFITCMSDAWGAIREQSRQMQCLTGPLGQPCLDADFYSQGDGAPTAGAFRAVGGKFFPPPPSPPSTMDPFGRADWNDIVNAASNADTNLKSCEKCKLGTMCDSIAYKCAVAEARSTFGGVWAATSSEFTSVRNFGDYAKGQALRQVTAQVTQGEILNGTMCEVAARALPALAKLAATPLLGELTRLGFCENATSQELTVATLREASALLKQQSEEPTALFCNWTVDHLQNLKNTSQQDRLHRATQVVTAATHAFTLLGSPDTGPLMTHLLTLPGTVTSSFRLQINHHVAAAGSYLFATGIAAAIAALLLELLYATANPSLLRHRALQIATLTLENVLILAIALAATYLLFHHTVATAGDTVALFGTAIAEPPFGTAVTAASVAAAVASTYALKISLENRENDCDQPVKH